MSLARPEAQTKYDDRTTKHQVVSYRLLHPRMGGIRTKGTLDARRVSLVCVRHTGAKPAYHAATTVSVEERTGC